MKIQKNVPLAEYTTFKIGGPAKYFLVAENTEDLIKAVKLALGEKLPYFILGGGSNVLVSDKGFAGLIILMDNQERTVKQSKITAEAAVPLGDLVKLSIDSGLTGLEWAAGIPGTIGGAVRSQTSAFGHCILESVKTIKEFNRVILSVELELKSGNKKKSEQLVRDYLKKKKNTQPIEYPSAGCIFKNPPGQFAGQLIENCGLKGRQVGQAAVSRKHANFIINLGQGQAEEVKKLIDLIKKKVKDKFDLDLEEEIQFLGF